MSRWRQTRLDARLGGLVRDHEVHGRAVLPAAGLVELVLAASGRAPPLELRDLALVAPLDVTAAVRVGVRLEAPRDGVERLEIRSCPEASADTEPTERWTRHAVGRLAHGDSGAGTLDLEALAARCPRIADLEALYARLDAFGLRYGPAYRSLRGARVGAQEALLELELPEEARGRRQLVPPALLDGVLQAAGLLPDEGGTALPFSFEQLLVVGPLPERGVAHLRRLGPADRRRLEIDLAGPDGRVLLRARGVALRAAPAPSPTTSPAEPRPESEVEALLHRPVWVDVSMPPHGALEPGVHAVFGASPEQLAALGAGLPEAVGLRADLPLEALASIDALRGVIHLGGTATTPADVLADHAASSLGLAGVLGALLRRPGDALPPIRVLSVGAEPPVSRPGRGGLAGLVRTALAEQPRLRLALLDLEAASPRELAPALGLAAGLEPGAWSVREGRLRTMKLAAGAPPGGAVPLPERPVVLVTGGATGIGALTAARLAERHRARLALVSRRGAVPAELRRQLESAGAEVLALAADVGDRRAVDAALDAVAARWGRLDAIVHSAAVLRDGLLRSARPEDLEAVAHPKLGGAVQLDAACADRGWRLSAFLAYSSASTAFGSPGQAGYVAANGALEAFMAHRAEHRGEPSRVVAWTLWSERGLATWAVPELERRGVRTLDDGAGQAALDRVLGLGAERLFVVHVPPSLADHLAPRDAGRAELPSRAQARGTTSAPSMEPMAGTRDGLHALEAELRRTVAEVLEAEPSSLDPDAGFVDLGIDSMLATSILERLGTRLGASLRATELFDHRSIRALARHLHGRSVRAPEPTPPPAPARPAPALALGSTALALVREAVAAELEAEPAGLDPHAGFVDLGVDSMIAASILGRLEQRLGATLRITDLFEHGSIARLAARIDALGLETRPAPSGAETAPAPALAPTTPTAPHVEADASVVIVGAAARVPGASSLDALWSLLDEGREAIVDVPAERWDVERFYDPDPAAPQKTVCRRGGFVADVDAFDHRHFGISAREAAAMDPQQRAMLELSWEALERAGHLDLRGTRTGVFIGVSNTHYGDELLPHPFEDAFQSLGNTRALIANRVSSSFDLRGPSQIVDTLCSSGLVALEQARRAIELGQCEAALVGAVNLCLSPWYYVSLSRFGALSPSGRCAAFGATADGFVPGEAAIVLVLRRADDARRDRDTVLARIRGGAVNHGGRSSGLTAPTPAAQAEVIASALRDAGLGPDDVDYVEAHGTGTALGDPVELEGLERAFAGRRAERRCGLGSIKSNLGHLEAAAGLAGVLKVLLAFEHERLPATLHARPSNPRLPLDDSHFRLLHEAEAWPAGGRPRRAGVSAFGLGGTNAHVVLEAVEPERDSSAPADGPLLLATSARTEAALRARLAALAEQQRRAPLARLDLATSLDLGQPRLPWRAAVVVDPGVDPAEALAGADPVGPVDAPLVASWLDAPPGPRVLALARALGAAGLGLDGVRARGRGAIAAAVFSGALSAPPSADEDGHGPVLELERGAHVESLALRPGETTRHDLLRALAALHRAGVELDLRLAFPDGIGRRVPLPGHPLERIRAWAARPLEAAPAPRAVPKPAALDIGVPAALPDATAAPSAAAHRRRVERAVLEAVGEALGETPDALDRRVPLRDAGIDSIVATGVTRSLETRLDCDLPATLLLDHGHLEAVIEALAALVPAARAPTLEARAEAPAEAVERASATRPRRAESTRREADGDGAVAIVGMAGRFPGARSPSALWRLLLDGGSAITEVPGSRWDIERIYDPRPGQPDKSYARWGGFIDDLECFDPAPFALTPREAELMDPQQRWLLQVAWEALDDAGLSGVGSRGRRVGVFVGASYSDYHRGLGSAALSDPHANLGNHNAILANRVSYALDLRGPCQTIDTLCSSGLVAVHHARRAVLSGDAELALAAGVFLNPTPKYYVSISSLRAASPTGRCHSFAAAADGYVPAEAVVAVLLKPLARALADGDPIHAVIRGSAIGHTGRGPGLTAPTAEAQAEVIARALEDADLSADAIGCIEAHGTGTRLGDPIEVEGLSRAFARSTTRRRFCRLGSIKSNLGHAEPAAGLVGLVKAALMVRYGVVPATLGCDPPNPLLPLEDSPFVLARETAAWPDTDAPRRAGVSAFGLGGANAHVVVEQPPPTPPTPAPRRRAALILASAASPEALRRVAEALAETATTAPLHPLAHTLAVGRVHLDHRLAVVVADGADLRAALEAWLAGRPSPVRTGRVPDRGHARLAILEGASVEPLRAQARRLLAEEPAFTEAWSGAGAGEPGTASPSELVTAFRAWAAALGLESTSDPDEADLWVALGAERPSAIVGLDDEALAALWVAGARIDWTQRDAGHRLPRVHAPSYPFEPTPLWRGDPHATVPTPSAEAPAPPEGTIWFTRALDPAADPILDEHRFRGVALFPLAGLLDAARTAAVRGAPGRTALTALRVLRPPRMGRQLNVRIAGDRLAIDDGEGAVFEARLEPAGRAPAAIDLPARRAELRTRVPAERAYAALRRLGLSHGPRFALLGDVELDAGRGLAPLEGARETAELARIDAGLQMLGAWEDEEATAAAGLPSAAARFVQWAPLAGARWAELVRHHFAVVDVRWLGADGRVLAALEGLRLAPARARSEASAPAPIAEGVVWRARWRPIPSELPPVESAPTGAASSGLPWLAIGDGGLVAALEAAGLGARIERLEDPRAWSARPFAGVLLLTGADPRPTARPSEALARGLAPLYALLAELGRRPLGGLRVLSRGAVSVGETEAGDPIGAGLWGFARSLAAERPELDLRLIDVPLEASEAEAARVAVEQWRRPDERALAWREGRAWARDFEPLRPPTPAPAVGEPPVVVVTGGLGELGLAFARQLASERSACLALWQRTPLPPRRDWDSIEDEALRARVEAVRSLERLGAQVLVQAVDVSDREAVEAAVARVRRWRRRVDLVVHAAGYSADRPAESKPWSEALGVIATKADGVAALDAATAEDAPRMILCGSIAGALGNPGQTDYAAGNAFLTAEAHHRRHRLARPTVALEWSAWRELGMARGLGHRLERLGLVPLDPAEAVGVFRAALETEDASWLVGRFRPPFPVEALHESVARPLREPSRPAPSPPASTPEDAAAKVRAAVAGVMRVEPEALPLDRPLRELGVDSLLAIEIARAVGDALDTVVDPVLLFDRPTVRALAQSLAPAPIPAPRIHVPSGAPEPIAVVAMACRFPEADDPDALWRLVHAGRSTIREVPPERWSIDALYDPEPGRPGRVYCRWGSFVDGLDRFDPLFFQLSPAEARLMDPQQRVMLELAQEALERAGAAVRSEGREIGVFVGASYDNYGKSLPPELASDPSFNLGNSLPLLANRLSFALDLRGPSVFVNTMCSSSLVAIDAAARSLRAGQCSLALAGGVHLCLTPAYYLSLCSLRAVSARGRCAPFGAEADGFLPGEGAGLIALRRLSDAERDGDAVLALIRGSAVNHGGRGNGLTAPRAEQQAAVLRAALAEAGVDAASVGLVEAHGTGTLLGDPIEARALDRVYGERRGGPPLRFGSLKGNLGHTEPAAGVAGVLKAIQSLRQRRLAPTLHAEPSNPLLALSADRLALITEAEDWSAGPTPRRAGVSAFGLGGTNAHVILEEAGDG